MKISTNLYMNNHRYIAFGYSTRCNLRCEHCVASNEIIKNAKMELDTARAVISEMARSNVAGISFTAGEPFLYIDDICELVHLCEKNGIYSRIVTNVFWAKTQEQSDIIVSKLKLFGLSQLRISYSRWHKKNIWQDNIINAAASCEKHGLDYFISFVTDFSEHDDPIEQFLRDNNLKYFPESLIYSGRAKDFVRPEIFTDYYPNTCPMNPYFTPDLDMFACCDAGSQFTNTNFFYLGNHKNNNIDELFQKKETNVLYNMIRTLGLSKMALSLGFKAREIVKYRKCELCEKLFNSPENLKKLDLGSL